MSVTKNNAVLSIKTAEHRVKTRILRLNHAFSPKKHKSSSTNRHNLLKRQLYARLNRKKIKQSTFIPSVTHRVTTSSRSDIAVIPKKKTCFDRNCPHLTPFSGFLGAFGGPFWAFSLC